MDNAVSALRLPQVHRWARLSEAAVSASVHVLAASTPHGDVGAGHGVDDGECDVSGAGAWTNATGVAAREVLAAGLGCSEWSPVVVH